MKAGNCRSKTIMYDQIRNDTLFGMLYAVVSALFLAACCYLLFRQGNAFARDVTPPVRLRRWTAAYFAATAVCHLWYMQIFFLTSVEDIVMTDLIGGLLDSVVVPLVIIVMLNMLQDRRRPLWPIALMTVPLVVGAVFNIATLSYTVVPMLYVYLLLLCVGIVIYMVRATRQYGRWLRDNYADLEHKEVWQTFVVVFFMLLVFVFYPFLGNVPLFLYAYQVFDIVLLGYLLWRVETLSDLSIPDNDTAEEMPTTEKAEDDDLSLSTCNRPALPAGMSKNIGLLLQQRCIDTQLYLQHDMTLAQLARTIGTNRLYLSQYFSSQGTTYNNYINDLRINHFIHLCREAADAQHSYTIQQLALESGYCSYSTFRDVIKRKTGKSVRAWMKEFGEP